MSLVVDIILLIDFINFSCFLHQYYSFFIWTWLWLLIIIDLLWTWLNSAGSLMNKRTSQCFGSSVIIILPDVRISSFAIINSETPIPFAWFDDAKKNQTGILMISSRSCLLIDFKSETTRNSDQIMFFLCLNVWRFYVFFMIFFIVLKRLQNNHLLFQTRESHLWFQHFKRLLIGRYKPPFVRIWPRCLFLLKFSFHFSLLLTSKKSIGSFTDLIYFSKIF